MKKSLNLKLGKLMDGNVIPPSIVQDVMHKQDPKLNEVLYKTNNLPQFLKLNYFESVCYPVSVFRYQRNAWYPAKDSLSTKLDKFSVTTLNVWFERNYYFDERTAAIIDMILKSSSQIFCLQEVIWSFLKVIIAHPKIQENFFISDIDGSTLQGYGVFILSRIPISNLSLHTLPTKMGRSCLIATILVNNRPTQVATVHLESLSNSKLREAQLFVIQHILKDNKDVVLCGDFNFDSTHNWLVGMESLENDVLKQWDLANYSDVWSELHPKESGWTFDSEKNRNIQGHKPEQMRYDRIMGKCNSWKLKSIKMIGKENIGIKDLHMSDHFGLECSMENGGEE
jgi:tyrosyl-DNA phosphodiesterase 2